MIQPIPFGSRFIGPGCPVVIIAEIGINHEGNPETCMRLVEAAASAGADAVKFQTLDADENYVPGTESHTVFSGAELSPEVTAEAFALARSLGMEVFTTAGDLATLAWIDKLAPAAHKISSGLITNHPLIGAAAATGRPLIFSSGMCGLDLLRQAIEVARQEGGRNLCVLQCTSTYPAPIETLHLRAISTLAEEFQVPSGFSDHSLGKEASVLAVAAGATVIEKHFSLDPGRPGFDHRLSVDPDGLRELVAAVRQAELMLGTAEKQCSDKQAETAALYLRSIVARRHILAGEHLSLENVGFMRTLPAKRGLAPSHWDQMAGRRVIRNIKHYETILPTDLEA